MPPKGYTIKTTAPTAKLPLGSDFPQSPYQCLLIAFSCGILMGLTPAPVNAWLLAWVALAPLWVLTVSATSAAAACLYALAWGIGYHGLALCWIRDLHPLTWMGVPWLASLAITGFCWLFITLWGAGSAALWSWLFWRCSKQRFREAGPSLTLVSPWLRVLVGTALWCGMEALRAKGVLDWTSLAYTQSPHDLLILHLGQLSGPLTVTAAIVACNGLLAEAWIHFRQYEKLQAKRILIFNAGFLLALHLLGWALYNQPLADQPDSAFKVGIVQGNIPTRIKLYEQGLQLSLRRYLDGYESLVAEKVDAVLMPEGALPWLWINQPNNNPLYRLIVERKVPAWVGTVGQRQGKITQTLFSIDADGKVVGRYDKIKLVPLGEYIPFEAVLSKVISRLSPVEVSMLPGQLNQRFETPFGQAIAGICYESAFADLFRRQAATGGQFILTASNNDPYGRAMMSQHHAQDVMRAIETGRWAVRATNTGLSGIVDPHGHTQWLSDFRTYQTHAHTVYRRQIQTLYVRWGNWLTPVLLGVAAIALISSLRNSRFVNQPR